MPGLRRCWWAGVAVQRRLGEAVTGDGGAEHAGRRGLQAIISVRGHQAHVVEALLQAGAVPWLTDGEGHDATARAAQDPKLLALLQAADGWAGLCTSDAAPPRAAAGGSSASAGFNPFAPRQAGSQQTRELKAMSADELRAGGAKYQRLIEERELASFGYS